MSSMVPNRHTWAQWLRRVSSPFASFLPKKENQSTQKNPFSLHSRFRLSSDMAALASLIDYLAAERLATSFDVAAAMLLVYDCSLMLGMEFEFVWSSPWGFVKVLYIVQRYLPFCDAIFLCLTHQLAVNIDPDGCHVVETIRGSWLFGSSYQRVDDFWFYFVRSNLDPARMGSMETGTASGCLSDIPTYAHNCGGGIRDQNLPSRPAINTGPDDNSWNCFLFPFAHKPPFQIGEERMSVYIISYIETRRSARRIHFNVAVVCALSVEYFAVISKYVYVSVSTCKMTDRVKCGTRTPFTVDE
ncbi:uncharacterized protein LACBIDRAFT_334882 [Laccaria bicolor S238N-H82]|uniref:Predicted protein n=1 Tax=Laccaria bicolor (strain S238N-H82 / ATCC MYA-4686) TaxID=486041 RepID=B0E0N2_LACBS|nr:uncharacterized protein LACBIDRAFT_334882 [Laccaria bicolor S238N-H82]EDQ99646.1 predicted protein [Laccaria bicolor S238N-H82]|eukprot:XP_001889757.1 predicted protein [Laccaria bicolor S238N-H82]